MRCAYTLRWTRSRGLRHVTAAPRSIAGQPVSSHAQRASVRGTTSCTARRPWPGGAADATGEAAEAAASSSGTLKAPVPHTITLSPCAAFTVQTTLAPGRSRHRYSVLDTRRRCLGPRAREAVRAAKAVLPSAARPTAQQQATGWHHLQSDASPPNGIRSFSTWGLPLTQRPMRKLNLHCARSQTSTVPCHRCLIVCHRCLSGFDDAPSLKQSPTCRPPTKRSPGGASRRAPSARTAPIPSAGARCTSYSCGTSAAPPEWAVYGSTGRKRPAGPMPCAGRRCPGG